jgi:hypothetical protein
MAVSSANYTITTTPSQVFMGNGATNVYLHSSSGTCFLGGSDVTPTTGYQLDSGDKLVLSTHESAIYACTSAGSTIVKVLILSK